MWNPEEVVLAQGLAPLTPKQLVDADRDCVYIFNVSPRQQGPIQVNGRNYIIPACLEGEDVSEPLKIPGTVFGEEFKRTIGICTNEFSRTQEDGSEVARKIMGLAAFCKPDQDLRREGCFISETREAKSADVNAARDRFIERCNDLVNEARGFYSINNGMVTLTSGRLVSNIASQHRMAAKYLGIEQGEPWASKQTVQMQVCDGCGVSVRPGLAFCANGCILDEAKARKAKPWLFERARKEA